MSNEATRKLFTEAAIGLSVCFGLHFMLADPMRQKLSETRAKVTGLERSMPSSAAAEDALPRAMGTLAKTEREAEEIKTKGLLARDETAMFSRIMQAATEHSTRIDQMQPRNPAQDVTTAPAAAATLQAATPPPPAPLMTREGDAAIGYSITASAEYSALCAFLRALQNDLGYTLVRSVRIQPATDPTSRVLTAVIETAHFAFNASPEPIASASGSETPGGIAR